MSSIGLACNRKVKFYKSQKNSFGLNFGLPEDGGTCPGATCGTGGCLNVRDGKKRVTCYMHTITNIYKATKQSLHRNTSTLKSLTTVTEIIPIIEQLVQTFLKHDKNKAPFFRIHYSGDFYSREYAEAWKAVILKYPQIRFWAYTRSLNLVEVFAGVENISLFISADPVNQEAAFALFEKLKGHPNIGICWMGDEPPKTYRWVACPEVTGKIKNGDTGACAKCRLCVDRYISRLHNIQFPIH